MPEARTVKQLVTRLGLLALGCGLLVSGLYGLSATRIDANAQAFRQQQLLTVVGRDDLDLVPLQADAGLPLTRTRFTLSRNGQLQGMIFPVQTRAGYNGLIRLWLAVDLQGQILGVRVIEHSETPGLGDKIELAVSNWIRSFEGKSLTNPTQQGWQVGRDGGEFDQFTGATITPRSVVQAVHAGLQTYSANKLLWLQDSGLQDSGLQDSELQTTHPVESTVKETSNP